MEEIINGGEVEGITFHFFMYKKDCKHKGYIYQIRNLKNSKLYIGQTTKENVEDRFNEHIHELEKNIHGNKYLQTDWNKYGKENFKFSIMKELSYRNEDTRRDKLNKAEIFFIDLLDSMYDTLGYNISRGGKGGFTYLNRKKNRNLPSKRPPRYIKTLSNEIKSLLEAYKLINLGFKNGDIRETLNISKHNLYSLKNEDGSAWEIIKDSVKDKVKGLEVYFQIYKIFKNAPGYKNFDLSVPEIINIYKRTLEDTSIKLISKEFNTTNSIVYKIKFQKGIYGCIIKKYFELSHFKFKDFKFYLFNKIFSNDMRREKIAILSNNFLIDLDYIIKINNQLKINSDDYVLKNFNIGLTSLNRLKNREGIYKFIFDEYQTFLKTLN